jgi:hypothetical protein
MARSENASARDRTPWTCRRRSGAARGDRARRAAAATLAATFIILLPIAAASAWIRGTVLSTGGYVAAISNVAASPAVRTVIREAITAEASAVLPRTGGALAGLLRTGLANLAGKETSAFMASPAFRRLWVAANRFAHAQLLSVLNGNSTLLQAKGKQVTLNLIPLVSDVLHGISRSLPAMIRRTITLPRVGAMPACQVPSHASASPCIQIPLFPAAALDRLRHAYRILTATTWLALTLTPLTFASALAASPRRRRTLLHMTAGGTLTLLFALTTFSWLQASLIARTDPRYQPVISAILHALTSSFFTLTTWCVAGSLTLTAVALLSGPYRWAATIRWYFRSAGRAVRP